MLLTSTAGIVYCKNISIVTCTIVTAVGVGTGVVATSIVNLTLISICIGDEIIIILHQYRAMYINYPILCNPAMQGCHMQKFLMENSDNLLNIQLNFLKVSPNFSVLNRQLFLKQKYIGVQMTDGCMHY